MFPINRALCLFFSLALIPASIAYADSDKFQPNWQSLEQYQCPNWYRDAKFGIFMHWSINSLVPAANDGWYGRQMYMQKGASWGNAYQYHVQTYGHPSKFGYKDLIPLWKAENFHPDDLVAIYKQAGARYIVPVAVHHDNFDNYASTYQPWNSVNMGPHKDLIGLWRDAILKAGLRFGVSSHSDRSWGWFETSHGSDVEGPLKGVPYDGDLRKEDGKGLWWEGYDPQDLYSPALKLRGDTEEGKALSEAYADKWYMRTKELVEKYQPDLIYFDGGLPMGDRGLKIAALFYNEKMKGDRTDAVINIKWNPDRKAAVEDMEKGLSNWIRPNVWQVDTSINDQWFIDDLPPVLNTDQIIHSLVDAVSKNGNLLLNVALRADGTIVDEEKQRLLAIGDWLSTNGEAIYGTRPTHIFGEGPTKIKNWEGVDKNIPVFTSEDIRLTHKGDVLYAIFMGVPQLEGVIGALGTQSNIFSGKISSLEILGCSDKIKWSQDELGLHFSMPSTPVSRYGFAVKILGLQGLDRDGTVRPQADHSVVLNCWDAQVTGDRLAPHDFEPALTDWDHPTDYPTWTFICPEAGSFDLNAWYSSNDTGASAVVSVGDQNFTWKIEKTKTDKDFQLVHLGTINVPKPGSYTLNVKPNPDGWHPVNLSYIQIKDPVTRMTSNGRIELYVDSGTMHGDHFFLQSQGGRTNIGGWGDKTDSVSWDQVEIPHSGKYEIFADESTANGDSTLEFSASAGKTSAILPKTDSWETYKTISLGVIDLKEGIQKFTIGANAEAAWNPVNLAKVTILPVK